MKRLITSVAVAAGIAVVLVPVAGARLNLDVNSGGPAVASPFEPVLPSAQANDRYAAELKLVNGEQLTQHDVLALARGPVSPNALDRIAAQLRVVPDSSPTTAGDGVSGRTIGIGVGGGLLVLLLAAGLVVTMRRSRYQPLAPA
jgi:hypothetical protein